MSQAIVPNSLHSIEAGKENPANKGLTYGETALKNAEKIMELAGRYAAKDNQTTANLVHLKDDIIVGEWRDSTYGKSAFLSTRFCCLGPRNELCSLETLRPEL